MPAGWSVCDGTSGTPDLRDRFVLGQTSTIGEIAGDTDHAHSGESDPTSLTTSTASPGGRSCSYPGCWCTMKSYTASHSHTFNHSHLVEDDTLQPPFYEVIFLMNTGAESILPGTIFAYSSTHTALSDDWEVCDGAGVCPDLRGRFLKGAPDGTGSGATWPTRTMNRAVDTTSSQQAGACAMAPRARRICRGTSSVAPARTQRSVPRGARSPMITRLHPTRAATPP